MAELSQTGRAVLGLLALGLRTGYEIKQFVDKTTRFFWAASYGQIYPELRRFEQQGLLVSRAEPSGGRARTAYELTEAGRDVLLAWLRADAEPGYELRDEGMLKLFFADVVPEEKIAIVRAMRERNVRKLAQLKTLEPHVTNPTGGPALTLELGIGFTQWFIEWCESTERRLAAQTDKE